MNLAVYAFTDEELKSNQRGSISPAQKEMLHQMAVGIRRSQRGTARVAIIFPLVGLVMILGLSLSNESARAALFSNVINLVILALIIPLVVVIFLLSIYFADKRADQLAGAQLSRVEGRVSLDETHSSKVGSTYYMIIGKVKFAFPEDVSRIFPQDSKIRVYYCEIKMLKLILSYEKID
jgi:hypothetical protein